MNIQAQIDEANRVARKIEGLISSLEAERAKAEKPELRHGDYGYEGDNRVPTIIMDRTDREQAAVSKDFRLTSANQTRFNDYTILGNIFDDLKALSKPLKSHVFTVKGHGKTEDSHIYAQWESVGNCFSVEVNDSGDWFWATPEELKELILNLRRLLHTAELEASHE